MLDQQTNHYTNQTKPNINNINFTVVMLKFNLLYICSIIEHFYQ